MIQMCSGWLDSWEGGGSTPEGQRSKLSALMQGMPNALAVTVSSATRDSQHLPEVKGQPPPTPGAVFGPVGQRPGLRATARGSARTITRWTPQALAPPWESELLTRKESGNEGRRSPLFWFSAPTFRSDFHLPPDAGTRTHRLFKIIYLGAKWVHISQPSNEKPGHCTHHSLFTAQIN